MSGYLAGKVWHSALDADLKPLAATLADIANDDGTSIYPSIDFVAWRLSCSRASVDRGLKALRDAKILEVVSQGGGRGKVTEYQLIEEKLPKRAPWKPRQNDVVYSETTSNSRETTSDLTETTSKRGLNHVIAVTQDSLPVRDPSVDSSLTSLDDFEKTSTSESNPSPEERKDPAEVYRVAKARFRKRCRKNLGELGESQGEAWAGALERHGEKALLGALDIWARDLGDFVKKVDYPIGMFLKKIEEHIEAFEIESSPAPSDSSDEVGSDMLTADDIRRDRYGTTKRPEKGPIRKKLGS